ncbi:uncharacterized protein LY89DRAFT_649533 [Mollisia scopiformis]|uniref:Rhodopsin domain-containing protein n=1 Tax=Mollisia scopiformis TaxID=149040 RepID=A0A194X432_MOLSC|nr:uncharacterized protein LY89DRAFT_649533 [Mollisia scopiformis]KUJ14945.1 hypothetical protein LY89DRAFT_649533 [Mollisia scopiformis]
MAYNGSQLLPGQSAPLEVLTATDQSGVILIAAALGLIFAIISLLIRVYLQLEVRHHVARDDAAVLLAMLVFVGQSSAVFVEVSKGFGKTLSDIPLSNLTSLQKASYSSDILYLVAVWLTKCSVAFLTIRLSPDKRHNFASNAVLYTSTLFVVISIFMFALGCNLSEPWLFIDTPYGMNMFLRWQIVAAFDIVTELALLALSFYLVGGLQLSRYKKFVVIFAFALRLPIIVAIAFRLHFLRNELSSSDPTLKGSLASVSTQIQISYAIIAATTPCLRPFMSALSTNYGAPAQIKTPSSTKKSDNSYALSSFSKNRGQEKGKQINITKTVPDTRWDLADHHASVVAGDNISFDSHSSIQMIIQKNTEWGVEFEGRSQRSELSPEPPQEPSPQR